MPRRKTLLSLAARAKRDARTAARRARARLAAHPRLPPARSIGRRGAPFWATPAWLERARSGPELARRFLLLVRRRANEYLAKIPSTTRCEKIKSTKQHPNSDVQYFARLTIILKGGLDPIELVTNKVSLALALAVEHVAKTLGPQYWSSHFRRIPNNAQNFRYWWGIRFTATENPISQSQGNDMHFFARKIAGTAESISKYDSDPLGYPGDENRPGASERYKGFARNAAAKHLDERALSVTFYVAIPKPFDDTYQLFIQRAKKAKVKVRNARSKKGKKSLPPRSSMGHRSSALARDRKRVRGSK